MQLQSLFDSVCRCFGHPAGPNFDAGYPDAAADDDVVAADAGGEMDADASGSDARRRNLAQRLGLKEKEWDELFGGAKEAQAVAEAKLAANPSSGSSRKRHKRRRSSSDIFRKKKTNTNAKNDSYRETISPQQPNSTFSRLLLKPSLALCFATPVRDVNEHDILDATQSIDNSDTNTLNTCEDTITSTVCFDNKYSHIVETRPPMPLFNQFKIGHQEDEIRNVIATDSHSSRKMIELLQQAQRDQQQRQIQQQRQKIQQQHQHQHQHQHKQQSHSRPPQTNGGGRYGGYRGSSSDSEDLPPVLGGANNKNRTSQKPNNNNNSDDDIPDVKALSSSADSSKVSSSSSSMPSPMSQQY